MLTLNDFAENAAQGSYGTKTYASLATAEAAAEPIRERAGGSLYYHTVVAGRNAGRIKPVFINPATEFFCGLPHQGHAVFGVGRIS